MTILEALPAGLRGLASNRGVQGALLRQFGPQWVVPPDDTDAWGYRLQHIVRAECVTELDDFSSSARDVNAKQLSESTALRDLVSVYDAYIAPVS
jgi:hypothetical protein